MSDMFAALAQIPEIAQMCNDTRTNIDELAWNRDIRKQDELFTNYIRRMAGYATAALDGAVMADDPWREPDNSAMGNLAHQGLTITAAADLEVATFRHSPMQVWAHLHSLIDQSVHRGRPRTGDNAEDPLHLGPCVPSDVMHERLTQLASGLVATQAPAILVSAIAHAELATLRPFDHGSYLIARSSVRMILAGRGVDTALLCAPEFGMYTLGRSAYVGALRDYASGTVEGMTSLVRWHTQAIDTGIQATLAALAGRQ